MRGVAITLALFVGTGSLSACSPSAQTETAVTPMKNDLVIKHADAKAASAILAASTDIRILDIRTPGEYSQGHIQGANMIDFKSANFAQEISKLDRHTPYVVHCASGGRSTKSLELFKELGFTNITHLDGGILGWKEAGLPLTTAN